MKKLKRRNHHDLLEVLKKKNHPCYHVEKNLQRTSGRQGWLELKAGEMKSIRGGCTPGVEQK